MAAAVADFLHELAIFSLKDFVFGIDTRQIQEIVTLKNPEFLVEPDENSLCLLLHYHNAPLPLINLYHTFRLPISSETIISLFSGITFVSFHHSSGLMGCWVESMDNMVPISPHALKAVPPIMTRAAQQICLWGFYELSAPASQRLIPLVDLPRVVTEAHLTDLRNALAQTPSF